jgi:predicted acetyltransferase
MRLVTPALEHLPSYVAALQTGWSPNNMRAEQAQEELLQIANDPTAFLASLDSTVVQGEPVLMPDGTRVPRLPGYRRWMWDGAFCGSIGFRWQRGTEALPPYCLGHIGYGVVPWKRQKGYATQALEQLLPDAQALGLRFVELTTQAHNRFSQRVIEQCGGVWVEAFNLPAEHGACAGVEWRYRIAL